MFKTRIRSKYSTDDFLRQVLIDLIKDESPADVYEADFSKVEVLPHEVYQEYVTAMLSYTATIGFDRQEPYTDYETYTENVPYTVYENGKAVTKTRREQRQRMVTKYKTVTDWSLHSGQHRASVSCSVENSEDNEKRSDFSASRFTAAWCETKDEDEELLGEYSDDDIPAVVSSDATAGIASALHHDLSRNLPGDRHKDVNMNVDEVKSVGGSLIVAEEYLMKIFYKDKLYLRRAFPFGDGLRISGDRFEKAKKEEIASLVWQKNVGPFKRAVFGMLAASAVAVLVPYWVALVPAAVIGFLFFLKYKKTAQKNETETAKNYRVQKIEALNKKLKSLGLAPARPNEL